MAVIRERDGKFQVQIRKKGIDLYGTFNNKNDANLWVKYKEELIDLIDAFDPPMGEMISLDEAINLKIQECKSKNLSKKDLSDYEILLKIFSKFSDHPINKITYSDLMNHFDHLMKTPVQRGGNPNDPTTGIKRLPSMHTVFRKFSYLSTVYEMLKKDGVEVDNIALKLCQYLRPKLKTEKATNNE